MTKNTFGVTLMALAIGACEETTADENRFKRINISVEKFGKALVVGDHKILFKIVGYNSHRPGFTQLVCTTLVGQESFESEANQAKKIIQLRDFQVMPTSFSFLPIDGSKVVASLIPQVNGEQRYFEVNTGSLKGAKIEFYFKDLDGDGVRDDTTLVVNMDGFKITKR